MKIRPHPPVDKTIGQEPSPASAPSARAAKPASGFSPGQLLSGRVLSLGNDGRVVLDINGRSVTAYSAVHLAVGEKVEFVVSRGGDIPWLALKNEGPAQQLFRLLATDAVGQIAEKLDLQFTENLASAQAQATSDLSFPFASLLSSLQIEGQPTLDNLLFSLLSFAPPKATAFSSTFVPQEKELLQLLAHLESAGPQSASDQGVIRQFVALQQAFWGFNQQAGNTLLLIAPLFFAGKSGWGEWLVRQEKEQTPNQTAGEAPLRFDFFLQLSNLGEMQLSLLVRDRNLQGTFFLEDETRVEHISSRLLELQDKLAREGFEAPAFSCRLKQQNNQLRLKKILEESGNIANLALIDLTA